MSRSLPVWLLASALAACVGCGGDAATDSGAVAEQNTQAAPVAGGAAAMPTGGTGMGTSASGAAMGAAGGVDMSAGMSSNSASGSAANPASMTGMTGTGSTGSTPDAAAMQAAYTANAGAGGAAGTNPAATDTTGADTAAIVSAAYAGGAYPGQSNPAATGTAGTDAASATGGAYPGSTNPSATGTSGAYPGGAYPGASGGTGTGSGGAVEKAPEGFDGKAQLAFRRGKEKDAIQYLYAYALTTDAGAESLLPTIRWVAGLKQPKLAVRWGAGIILTAPRNYTGDWKPVGSQQALPTREGKGKGGGGNEGYVGGGGGTESGAGGGGASGGTSLLTKGAGELGEKLAAAYTERVTRGDFGEVLKKAMEGGSGGNQGNSGGGGAGGYPGAGADGIGFGAQSVPGGASFGGSSGGGGGLGAAAAAATEVTQIMPGLSMLGVGTQKELIERAREDGIDAIVIIDVKLRVNATNLVTNDSTISLIDTKTQKKLGPSTKAFNNIGIQKARAEGKEDGVDKELEKLFAAIDTNFKMTDLPAGLTAEIAAKRVAGLAAETHDNPLPILAEARMYYSKGLLEESQLNAAYEQILGVDSGRLLATGTEEDKKNALAKWLPES